MKLKRSPLPFLAAFAVATVPLQAATIALYDFQNYAAGSTGNTAPASGSPGDRIYDVNSTLPTGITVVSPITFTVAGDTVGQDEVNNILSSNRFRWRMAGPPVTASFSVTVAAGYELSNFAVSMIQYANTAGTINVTYNSIAMGPVGAFDSTDGTIDSTSLYTTNTIATALTGTVNFVITADPSSTSKTSRWDDFTLTGDVALIPEPSTALLCGVGMLLLLRRRRN